MRPTWHARAEINGNALVTVQAAEHPEHTDHSLNDNALYSFQVGRLRFMHMGDLGFELSPEKLGPFKHHCDVFMAIRVEQNMPTYEEVGRMVDFLEPPFLSPMHYNIPPLLFGMSGIAKFLNFRSKFPVYLARHHTVSLSFLTEVARPTIVVLEPSRYDPV